MDSISGSSGLDEPPVAVVAPAHWLISDVWVYGIHIAIYKDPEVKNDDKAMVKYMYLPRSLSYVIDSNFIFFWWPGDKA